MTGQIFRVADTRPALPSNPGVTPAISCIVCAYNEAEKIRQILYAIHRHPLLHEIIVVDDGSSDETANIARAFFGVRVISYTPNQGKTHAMRLGIEAAGGDYIMLLDADLCGVTAADIHALAEPVLRGTAEVSISLRANSLALYRMIGLDFVSGERLIPARLIRPHLDAMRTLPRWGGEVFINNLVTRAGLPIAVVSWSGVFNMRKAKKVGWWRGLQAELSMTGDVLRVLSPVMVVRQNLAMLSLVRRRAHGVKSVWRRPARRAVRFRGLLQALRVKTPGL
ncbi:MAG: glycosyltransferase family 2 protein [Asticcacaulis sp.]